MVLTPVGYDVVDFVYLVHIYTQGDSDVIMSSIATAAMLEVYHAYCRSVTNVSLVIVREEQFE